MKRIQKHFELYTNIDYKYQNTIDNNLQVLEPKHLF